MSDSPIVADHLHKHNTLADAHTQPHAEHDASSAVKTSVPRRAVDLPSLDLADPIGTTVRIPLPHQPMLKNTQVVSNQPSVTSSSDDSMDRAWLERLTKLQATSAALRQDAQTVRRNTGTPT